MTFYEILVHTALVVWTLIGLGLLVGTAMILPQLLRTMRAVDDMADVVKTSAQPVLEQSEQVLEQLSHITTVISDDIEIVDETIVRAADSVERMLELTEDRVAEMNALLTVAIDEAEDAFVATAGFVRAIVPGGEKPKRRWLSGKRRRFG